MFRWFRKKRIQKVTKQAKDYVCQHLVEGEHPEIRFSREISNDRTLANDKPDGFESIIVAEEASYVSGKDRYDAGSIQRTVKSMSNATSAESVIRALESSTNMTFVDKMLEHIDKRHLRDSDVYRAAQVDRRLFSKIISDREYKPAKDTCVAFAYALRLSLDEAEDLLSRAGYTLSHSSKRDVLLEYFFKERIYNLFDINDILERLDQKVIGRF